MGFLTFKSEASVLGFFFFLSDHFFYLRIDGYKMQLIDAC